MDPHRKSVQNAGGFASGARTATPLVVGPCLYRPCLYRPCLHRPCLHRPCLYRPCLCGHPWQGPFFPPNRPPKLDPSLSPGCHPWQGPFFSPKRPLKCLFGPTLGDFGRLWGPFGALGVHLGAFGGSQCRFFDRSLQRNWGSGILPRIPRIPPDPAELGQEPQFRPSLPRAGVSG